MNVMRQTFPVPVLKPRVSPAIISSHENELRNLEELKKNEEAIENPKKNSDSGKKEKAGENESANLIKLQPVEQVNSQKESISEEKVQENEPLSGLFNNNKSAINLDAD